MRERRAPTSDLLFANSRPPHPLRVREREPSRRSITCSQRTNLDSDGAAGRPRRRYRVEAEAAARREFGGAVAADESQVPVSP
jgi:hypothetical protein